MPSVKQILVSHFSRFPRLQVQDVYKLLHQAAMGSEHALVNIETARERLEQELLEMVPGLEESLIDPISPNGRIARIHLRPFLALGRDPESLLQAFIQTAATWRKSPQKLKGWGRITCTLAESGLLPFSFIEAQSFFNDMEIRGFPAVHHSQTYQQAYHPAYRVVAVQYLEDI